METLTPYLEFICAALGVAGALLNIRRNRWGFVCWAVGNVLWMVYGELSGQWWFAMQYAVFLALAIWGFQAWRVKTRRN